jgi:hypothetical protein
MRTAGWSAISSSRSGSINRARYSAT